MKKNYITRDDVYKQTQFIMTPKQLFTARRYKGLSSNGKVLYLLLLDRTQLSIKNNFFDKNNRAFVFCTRKEASEMLNVTERTISKVFKELSDFSLIEDVKQGYKKANKIYVLHPAETKKDEAQTKKKIENRKTMLKKKQETLKKLNTSIKIKKAMLEKVVLKQDKYKNMEINKKELTIPPILLHNIKNQIEYDYFIENGDDINVAKETIDTLVLAIAEMQTSPQTKVGEVFYNKEQLNCLLSNLDSSMVIDFLPSFYKSINLCEIRNLKSYIKVSLVNYIQNLNLSFSKTYYGAPKPKKKYNPSYNLEELLNKSPLYIPQLC